MIIKEFLIFFVMAVLSQSSFADDDSSPYKLKAVYVTIRSGQTVEPDTKWTPEINVVKGFMENTKLSEDGRQTIYDLGKTVKEYYGSKFGESKEIKLLSNGCGERRCNASAALFRKGFENQEFNKEQEVSDADMKDTLIKEEAELSGKFYTDCKPFMEEAKKSVGDMWKDKQNEFSETIKIIKEKLSEKHTTPYNLWLTWETYYAMSKPKPDWLNKKVEEDLKKISAEYLEATFSSKNARKLSGGYLLGEIQGDIPSFDDKNFEQVQVYSGTLPELEATAAWFSGPNGYYKKDKKEEKWNKWNYLDQGSLVAIEVHAKGDSTPEYGVKVLIKNGKENLSDDSAVIIKGCDQEICPLKKVVELLKDYATDMNALYKDCKDTKTLP